MGASAVKVNPGKSSQSAGKDAKNDVRNSTSPFRETGSLADLAWMMGRDGEGPSMEGLARKLASMPLARRQSAVQPLQRTRGNGFVHRLAIQAKLQVGLAGNKYEQEADRVADQVMGMTEPANPSQKQEGEPQQNSYLKPAFSSASRAKSPGASEYDSSMDDGLNRAADLRLNFEDIDLFLRSRMQDKLAINSASSRRELKAGGIIRQAFSMPSTPILQRQVGPRSEEDELLHGKFLPAQRMSEKSILQRVVKVSGHTINSLNYDSYREGITGRAKELAHKKGWTKEFKRQVVAKIEELVNSVTNFPPVGAFSSYQKLIQQVAKELKASGVTPGSADLQALSQLPPRPILSGSARIDVESYGSLMEEVYDEASQYREFLQESGEVEAIPEEFRIAADRRQQQKLKVLDPSQIPVVSIGKHQGEVRGHGNVLTPIGGGKGETYAELCETIALGLGMFKSSEPALAQAMLGMLHGDDTALLKFSNFVLSNVDHLLTILAGPESTRATSSVVHFAATIYAISQGRSSFKNAFSGSNAIFLGANEGGAEALRLAPPSNLRGQAAQAAEVLEQYLSNFGAYVDISSLIGMLQTNIASYSRKRKGQ